MYIYINIYIKEIQIIINDNITYTFLSFIKKLSFPYFVTNDLQNNFVIKRFKQIKNNG